MWSDCVAATPWPFLLFTLFRWSSCVSISRFESCSTDVSSAVSATVCSPRRKWQLYKSQETSSSPRWLENENKESHWLWPKHRPYVDWNVSLLLLCRVPFDLSLFENKRIFLFLLMELKAMLSSQWMEELLWGCALGAFHANHRLWSNKPSSWTQSALLCALVSSLFSPPSCLLSI